MTVPTLPNLDGLIGLARQDGVDVRPTLVRVLTDLYVQKRTHTADEEHRYSELALWLLAGVDVDTRAAVAKKLATYPHAPRLVVRRLARDVIEVADPILASSLSLTSDDLLAIIRDFGPRHAAAIGARHSSAAPASGAAKDAPVTVSSPIASKDAAAGDGPRAAESSERQAAPAARSEAPVQNHSPIAGVSPAAREGEAVNLGERFLSAGSAERRLLLERLDDESLPPRMPTLPARCEDVLRELEGAAMQRRPDDFARGLERALGISTARARQIVYDETGEPVVIVAKALAAPTDGLVRILLFLNPRVGHSVERVFSLVDLYEQLTTQAAHHVVASWQNAHEKPKADYRPLHWNDERPKARHTFAVHGRRVMVQVPDGRTTRRMANSGK
jgi:uncharacterized protein (DUF2336 family)